MGIWPIQARPAASTLILVAREWERLLGVATGMAERLADQARQQLGEFSATQSEGIWEQVNRTLHDHYAALAESIQTSMNIGWGLGGGPQATTPAYPLRSHATRQRGATVLRYTSQISRQHEVLREGPSGVIDVRDGAIGSYGKIKAAIAEIGQFIEDSGPFIREQLQAAAS